MSSTKHYIPPDKLAEEWAEDAVQLPRMPFLYINLYQFCLPIFLLLLVDYVIFYLYEIFTLPVIYQIILFPIIIICFSFSAKD